MSAVDPLVSVIIIFFNEGQFITEALESVLSQKYNAWELLLVDDGSTDNSSAIAKEFAREFPDKVRYLTHPDQGNRGMSASRNLGIEHARGEYIGFLDADDVWMEHKLAEQVDIMESFPQVVMVYGRTLLWHGWTVDFRDARLDYFMPLGVIPNRLYAPPELLSNLFEDGFQSPTTCNALIRRIFFSKKNLFEESFAGMYEDRVFFIKLMLTESIYVSDKFWAKYRQHADSCVANSHSPHSWFEDQRKLLKWLHNYLTNEHVTEPIAWAILAQQQNFTNGHVFYRWLKFARVWYLRSVERYKLDIIRRLPEPIYQFLRARFSTTTHYASTSE